MPMKADEFALKPPKNRVEVILHVRRVDLPWYNGTITARRDSTRSLGLVGRISWDEIILCKHLCPPEL
jgi:hypothetical protein